MIRLKMMKNQGTVGKGFFPDLTDGARIDTILLMVLIMGTLLSSVPLLAAEKITTSQDQKSIAVTIYNENLALIKDSRNVELSENANQLAWREVSALIRPETALLRNQTSQSNFHILEQNFDFDLLKQQNLLKKHVGKEISVVRTNSATGIESNEMAVVLSTNEGIVLKFNNRIETGVPGRMVFPSVPENLRDKPTLLLLLHSPEAGKHELELSYLTGGLSWRADYVAALNEDDSKLDLNGLVTLTNQSGVTYPQARLQLVAGDVNQIQSEQRISRKMVAMSAEVADAAQMKEESLFEYHLYTLQRPTTLAENQTKQVALMSASQIPVNKVFLLQGADYYYSGKYGVLGQKLKINVLISFDNKGEQLGIPLPKGIVRVYKKDTQGYSQFIGEDQIDHTPKNEKIRLKLGNAFDITADKVQTDFQQIAGSMHQTSIFETAYEIAIRNAKKESVVVQVQEPIPGDWLVVSESIKHKKLSSNAVEWSIPVPAEGEATFTYRVRVKY